MSGFITGNSPTEAPWRVKAASKRAAGLARIPIEWRISSDILKDCHEKSDISVLDIPSSSGILTKTELEITEYYSATALAKEVQSGAISASSVALAFCKRAAIAQQVTNCLTETFFDDAVKRGQFLDEFLAVHGRPVGPLHGVPISLKDTINCKGVASTLALIAYLDKPVEEQNSPLVDILLGLGAILYCKTNIPQTMMTADSDNNVFGRVLNPHKLSLGAGGSSGGEGALIAMRGSILGIGTDIGGSVRIPGLCCGTYGFKPSTGRVSNGGMAWCSRRGSPGFPGVAGPLANSFQDLCFLVENVISPRAWDEDASAMPVPWRAGIANSKPTALRVGYLLEDQDYRIQPPVLRAMETTARKLAAAGLNVVPLHIFPSMQLAWKLVLQSFSLDSSRTTEGIIEAGGEPWIPSIVKVMARMNPKPDGYTLGDVFDLNAARADYKAAWNKIFVDNKLDVVLCPGAMHTAVPHDEYGSIIYTAVWNLLEYPGVVIPVGFADSNIDVEDPVSSGPERIYDAKAVHGAPTSVQIVARSYHDEELIAAGRLIDTVLKQ